MLVMQVEIFLNKSVDENASMYFEEAKKAKKKIEGVEKAIAHAKSSLEKSKYEDELKDTFSENVSKEKKEARKTDWYENFRWFFTSEGFLVIGGRDANTNENIIKKHTDNHDIVFHTDMAGSPFVVIKTEGKKPDDLDMEEAAQFTACYSRAWKKGLGSSEVFYVDPEQVSKTVKAGEFMGKGSFMIYGKRNYMSPVLKLAIGYSGERIEYGPLSSVKKRCKKYVEIVQGSEKASNLAKKIKKKIGGDLDEIVRAIPSGGARLVKGYE